MTGARRRTGRHPSGIVDSRAAMPAVRQQDGFTDRTLLDPESDSLLPGFERRRWQATPAGETAPASVRPKVGPDRIAAILDRWITLADRSTCPHHVLRSSTDDTWTLALCGASGVNDASIN